MTREVKLSDAEAILNIYNHYILHTVISFETAPLSLQEMRGRIGSISAGYPYFVCESVPSDGSSPRILGYCYAHPWKERAAYDGTWEVTIYLAPDACGHGLGTELMQHLICACRQRGCRALIGCITYGNDASIALHVKSGFRKVSHFEKVGKKFGRMLDVVDYELVL